MAAEEKSVQLQGRTAIVTGSSRGIGKAIALAYGREGANVVVTARTETVAPIDAPGTINETVEAINAMGSGKAIAIPCDVTREEQVKGMVTRALDAFGHIDILVNNAGGVSLGGVLDMPAGVWDSVIALNLRGVFLCCKYVLPTMVAQQRGSVINVTSGAADGTTPWGTPTSPMLVAYCTAKAAAERLTLCLAEEVRQHNIAVNAFRPEAIRTERSDRLQPPDYSRYDPVETVVPPSLWLARQEGRTFTGHIVSRFEFGKSWP